jgi:hypothetical protein
LRQYLASRESLKYEIARKRDLVRVPVTLPDGSKVALSPGGQNPLIKAMQSFVSHIAWESEVWIAEDPDHMIHFDGERFLGPYPDVMPSAPYRSAST